MRDPPRDSFAAFYEACYRPVFRYVLLGGGPRDDVEDVVADAFAQAYRAWLDGRGPRDGSGLAWILTIARRVRTDHARRGGFYAALAGPDARQYGVGFRASIDVLESMGSDVYAYFTKEIERGVDAAELAELARDSGRADTGGSGDTVVARIDAATRIREGDDAELWADLRSMHVFDPATGRIIPAGGPAKPGDLVFVSGTVGDAGAGLAMLRGEAGAKPSLIARYRAPGPPPGPGRARAVEFAR